MTNAVNLANAAPGLNGSGTNVTVAGNLTVSGGMVPSSSFLRNKIINGTMDFWQRGTSGFGPGGYGADRWYLDGASATSSRSTDVPNSTFLYSNEWGYPGTASCSLRQRIEAANCRDLAGQTVTVSFWAKSISGTTALSYSLSYPATTDNFSGVSEGNIASFVTVAATPSTSWTYYTFSVAVPAAATTGLQLSFNRNSGGSATTRITGVQLEVGSVATPFERRQYGQELALCQRYFQKPVGSNDYPIWRGYLLQSSVTAFISYQLKVSMRTAPTMTGTFQYNQMGSGAVVSDVDGFVISGVSNGSNPMGEVSYRSWTASAEL